MSATQEVGDIFGAGKGPAQAMLRSPTVLIVSVGLWGMNIFFFQLFGIDFKYVFQYDVNKLEKTSLAEYNKHNNNHHNNNNNNNNTERIIQQQQRSQDSAAETANLVDINENKEHDNVIVNADSSIAWYKLVAFSISLLFVLHFTTHFWMDKLGRSSIGAVFSFYGAVALYTCLPLPSTKWLRRAANIVIFRTWELIHPRFTTCIQTDKKTNTSNNLRPIPFVDVFYADAMCSLSKVFFDWGMLGHMASHYPEPVPPSAHNIIIPSICAAIPYLVRARQCLVMLTIGGLKKDPKRYQHLANAIKYSTSIFPLILSAYQKTIAIKAQEWEGLLVFLLFVNASYSLYWDIAMDWGMMQDPNLIVQSACGGFTTDHSTSKKDKTCHHALLRPRLRYGLTISIWIVLTDCLLRFSWMLRFAHHLFPSNDAFVLFTQFLEVFRRSIWNLLRVEWENIKQRRQSTSEDENDEEEMYLLATFDDNVDKAILNATK